MTKRFLANDLNIKDETRLVNATSKLTDGDPASRYTYEDNVIPVMLAAIEENQVDSSVDLLTCVRDTKGSNRLCVDNSGLISPSRQQQPFNVCYIEFMGDQIVPGFIPIGYTMYITGVLYTNDAAVVTYFDLFLETPFSSTLNQGTLAYALVPSHQSFKIENLCIPVISTDILTIQTSSLSETSSVSLWGFIQ